MGLNLCPPEMMLLRHIQVSYMGEESFISDAYIPFYVWLLFLFLKQIFLHQDGYKRHEGCAYQF